MSVLLGQSQPWIVSYIANSHTVVAAVVGTVQVAAVGIVLAGPGRNLDRLLSCFRIVFPGQREQTEVADLGSSILRKKLNDEHRGFQLVPTVKLRSFTFSSVISISLFKWAVL
jgi:hypothetical protein